MTASSDRSIRNTLRVSLTARRAHQEDNAQRARCRISIDAGPPGFWQPTRRLALRTSHIYGSRMRPLQVLIVFLILGGCSSNLSEQEPAQLIPAPPEASQRDISVTLSPAGRSASPKTETGLPPHGNSLMDCVTDPCTINCSKSVAKQSKQKRCAHFKEPVVAKPAVAANVVSKERSKSPDKL